MHDEEVQVNYISICKCMIDQFLGSIHLYVDAHKCSEITKLLSHAKLVKEFIVNLSSG